MVIIITTSSRISGTVNILMLFYNHHLIRYQNSVIAVTEESLIVYIAGVCSVIIVIQLKGSVQELDNVHFPSFGKSRLKFRNIP